MTKRTCVAPSIPEGTRIRGPRSSARNAELSDIRVQARPKADWGSLIILLLVFLTPILMVLALGSLFMGAIGAGLGFLVMSALAGSVVFATNT